MNSPVRQPVLAVCVLLTGTLIASALPPLELVSGAGRISRSAGGDSWVPMVSGDGQWIAFQSTAPNLVARDVNGVVSDVMVREGASGVTRLVSVTPGGESGNGESVVAGISHDGRYVLFVSDASDLVAGDDNEASDVFVRDLVAGVTRLVSVTPAGGSGSAASVLATFSSDARFVLFESDADDLVAGDTNGVTDVFQRDLETGITRRISVPSTDPLVARQPTGPSGSAWQSADGRTVVFQSEAQNLAPPLVVAGQARLTNHLYYLRPPALTNRMVNAFQITTNLVRPRVVIENLGHAMSADGRSLVTRVQSSVPSEVPDGLFHLDLDTGVSARLNQDIAGAFDVGSSDLTSPQITADGQTVFFEIMELDPVSGRPALPVVYRWEAVGGVLTRVSSAGWVTNAVGEWVEGREGNLLGASPDGSFVAMLGGSTNDAPGQGTLQLTVRHVPSGELRRVSRTVTGGLVDIGGLPGVTFSDDGRRLVFHATTSSLVTGDLNENWDVFLYDWDTDTLSLVSEHGAGQPSVTAFGAVNLVQGGLSADGRYVAYLTTARGFAAGDEGFSTWDAVRRDRVTGSNLVISVDATGTSLGNFSSQAPVLNADGRFAAFASAASNLVPGDTNGATDIFLRDLELGRTWLVSRRPDGGFPRGSSGSPVISPDGRWVAFVSASPDLSPLDREDGGTDVFLYDRTGDSVVLVTVDATGTRSGGGRSGQPAISPDGQWLVFESLARDLVTEALPAGRHLYRRSLSTGEIKHLQPGVEATDTVFPGPTSLWSFSPDARYVAFLANTRQRGRYQVMLHDFQAGTTVRVVDEALGMSLSRDASRMAYRRPAPQLGDPSQIRVLDRVTGLDTLASQGPDGAPGNAGSDSPMLSADGRWLVFGSSAENLVAGDDNGFTDVFVKDLSTGALVRVGGDSITGPEAMSWDGRVLVLRSASNDLVPGDFNGNPDLFALVLDSGPGRPRIHGVSRTALGELQLAWLAEPGRTYTVEHQDTVGGTWVDTGASLEMGDASVFARIPMAAERPQRFYRVVSR